MAEHRAGAPRGARYLRGRGPLALALAMPVGSRGEALRLERTVKALPKRRKEALVAGRESVDAGQSSRSARQRAKSSRVPGSVGG